MIQNGERAEDSSEVYGNGCREINWICIIASEWRRRKHDYEGELSCWCWLNMAKRPVGGMHVVTVATAASHPANTTSEKGHAVKSFQFSALWNNRLVHVKKAAVKYSSVQEIFSRKRWSLSWLVVLWARSPQWIGWSLTQFSISSLVWSLWKECVAGDHLVSLPILSCVWGKLCHQHAASQPAEEENFGQVPPLSWIIYKSQCAACFNLWILRNESWITVDTITWLLLLVFPPSSCRRRDEGN